MLQKMDYDWKQSSASGAAAPPGHHTSRLPDVTAGRSAKQQRRKPLPEGHFDPDELCRRLYLVLADQKAHAERKRRARTEAAIPSSSLAAIPSSSSAAPRAGTTSIITNININNNTNISNNNNTYNSNLTKSSRHQAHDTRRRPESYPASSRQPEPANAAPSDLITELRRSRSSAKRRASRYGLAIADPNTTIDPSEQYHNRQSGEYHHVPKEAAKQFARTTTVDMMRTKESESFVHQLSKRALRFHRQGRTTSAAAAAPSSENTTTAPPLVPSELNRALRQSQSQREKLLDRNQFQRTRVLQEAAQLDHEREREEALRRSAIRPHTFERELACMSPAAAAARRNSTGNTEVFDRAPGDEYNRRSAILLDPLLDADEDALDTTPPEELLLQARAAAAAPHEHRVDWSQSDESGRRPKLLLSPLLRKADSLWGLRSRLGSKASGSALSGTTAAAVPGGLSSQERSTSGGGASRESVTATPAAAAAAAATDTSATTPKSPKSSFFAKFKR